MHQTDFDVLDFFDAIDLFCGAGGVSSGMENSGVINITDAINHDEDAIAAYKKNHPNTKVHPEDIVHFDLHKLSRPRTHLLWGSVECTNYSKAKGGGSRSADSRTLPYQMLRYAKYLNPYYIVVENVEEILSWGPLIHKKDRKGRPVYNKKGEPVMVPESKTKGVGYMLWVKDMKALGYTYDYRLLDAADYGAGTNRIRYFGVFAKEGLPISFPNPTHQEIPTPMFNEKKWVVASDYLELDKVGKSIFGRKKPYSEKTYRRVAGGVGKEMLSSDSPLSAFIASYYGTGSNVRSINRPLPVIPTKDRHTLVFIHERNQFISQHIHGSNNHSSVDKPMKVILTKDLKQLVTVDSVQYLLREFGTSGWASLDKPLGVVTTVNKTRLVELSVGESLFDEKLDFFLKFFFLEGRNKKQKKTECPFGRALFTAFILDYVISDISMRYLSVSELKEGQGFDKDYILSRTQSKSIKFIGNSVCPQMAEAIVKHLFVTYNKFVKKRKVA